MERYFDISRSGISLEEPLWKLRKNYSNVWDYICYWLSNDLSLIHLNSLSKSFDTVEDVLTHLSLRSAMTFGSLIKDIIYTEGSTDKSTILLKDLLLGYIPLEIEKQICADNEEPLLLLENGSSIVLKIKAEGVPQPSYEWHYYSSDESESILVSTNFEGTLSVKKTGYYYCNVRHHIPLIDDSTVIDPIIKSDVIRVQHKFNIISQPKSVECSLLSDVMFEVEAVSYSQLKYKWIFNESPILYEESKSLNLKSVRFEAAGSYKCRITSEDGSVLTTEEAQLVVLPYSNTQGDKVVWDSEKICILKQPEKYSKDRAPIGEYVVQSILAVSKYKLCYEWIKRGVSKNMVNKECPLVFTPLIPVCKGNELRDTIQEFPGIQVSFWVYRCIISCPQTGEKKWGRPLKIYMSRAPSNIKSHPDFKLALVICQEDYIHDESFHELRASRYDGCQLIALLEEIEFEVISFVNLTVIEMRKAIELLKWFVDDSTSVLIYYSGHAIGVGTEIYLTGIDSKYEGSDIERNFIWHGEFEQIVDKWNPLLCVFIYDSCRGSPLNELFESFETNNTKQVAPMDSSYIVSYSTQPSLKSLEYYEKSTGKCQGLYMKYLLKHLGNPNSSIEEVFNNLTYDFINSEDPSVVQTMRPEVKISTKKPFYLGLPLYKSASKKTQCINFFNTFRFESLILPNLNSPIAFETDFSVDLSLENGDTFHLIVKPSTYLNEALVRMWFGSKNPNLNSSWQIRVLGCNARLLVKNDTSDHGPYEVLYEPTVMGPIFNLVNQTGIAEFKLSYLQQVKGGSVKLKVNLIQNNDYKSYDSIENFSIAIPIVHNCPGLKKVN